MLCQWSSDGTYLACAAADSIMFPIKIYLVQQRIESMYNNQRAQQYSSELPPGPDASRTTVRTDLALLFSGHHDIIYDLSWNTDSSMVLTASADGTAKIWNTNPHLPNNTGTIVQLQYEQQQRQQGLLQPEKDQQGDLNNNTGEPAVAVDSNDEQAKNSSTSKKLTAAAVSAIQKVHTFAAVLQHTCFVYTAKWHPTINR